MLNKRNAHHVGLTKLTLRLTLRVCSPNVMSDAAVLTGDEFDDSINVSRILDGRRPRISALHGSRRLRTTLTSACISVVPVQGRKAWACPRTQAKTGRSIFLQHVMRLSSKSVTNSSAPIASCFREFEICLRRFLGFFGSSFSHRTR